MDFGSSRLLKSFGGFGRAKTDEAPEAQAPADMSGRLARVREAALANDAEGRRVATQGFMPAPQETVDALAEDLSEEEAATPPAPRMATPAPFPTGDARTHSLEPMAAPVATATGDHDALINWLEAQDPAVWHYFAAHWDWERGIAPLAWIAQHPRCDAGTAAMLFWASGEAEDYLPFGDAEPTEDHDLLVADLAEHIAGRFEAEDFAPAQFAFDEHLVQPHFPERLDKLYREERMDWDAYKVPTRASGELVLVERFDRDTEAALNRWLDASPAAA